jgi:hypothetical protein
VAVVRWVDGAPDDVGSMFEWSDKKMQKGAEGHQVQVYKVGTDV